MTTVSTARAFYERRLARAAESLLLPFGWTEERFLRVLDGGDAPRLDDFEAREKV